MQKVRLKELGAILKLTKLIEERNPENVTDSAIMALCTLPAGSEVQLEWSDACIARLLERMKENLMPQVQLDCCACISLMCSTQGAEAQVHLLLFRILGRA